MKKHFAKLLLLGAMIVAGFSFVGCNDIEKELADLNSKVENLESESTKNLQDAINALNAKLASDYALKTDLSALEIALNGTIAEQVAVAEAKINKAIEDAIAACKAESADAIAKVAADLAKVSEELTAVADDVKAATAKIDENAAEIAGVDAKVLELKGTIDALSEYLDTLEGMARENKATLDSFAEYFAEYKGEVDMKLTELHGSLGALSVYLEELEASIDARFAEHQNTFLALSAFLEEYEIEVDAKFKEILGTFDALAAHLEEREAKVDFALEEIRGTFEALSPEIETMQAQILENHNTLLALSDFLAEKDSEINLKFTELRGQLDALAPVIETMQAQILENHNTLLALSDFLEEVDYQGQIDSLKADVAASIAMARELDQTLRFDLAAHIKTLEDQLAALAQKDVDVQAVLDAYKQEIEAMKTTLGLVGEQVAIIANQIQSIVYVPEYEAGMQAYEYSVPVSEDDTKDFILVQGTFEVSPKHLADKITSKNAFFSAVRTKAANAAELFEAKVVDTDATTGRVVAYAYVPATDADETDVYEQLTTNGAKPVVLAFGVADANLVQQIGTTDMIDLGSYTSSSFVKAVYNTGVKDADDFLVFYDEAEEETIATVAASHEIPFSTTVENSSRNLFDGYSYRVKLANGEVYTLADAAELFNVEALAVTYGEANDPVYSSTSGDNAATKYISATGENFEASAKLIKAASADQVGHKVTVTVDEILLNEVETNLTAVATYEIVNETAGGVVVDDITKTWAYDEVAWWTSDKSYHNAFSVDELNVTGISDIEDLLDPVTNNIQLATTVGGATYYAYIYRVASKIVSASIPELPFGKSYTFTGKGEIDNVDYPVSLKVTIGAEPEDATINLGKLSAVVSTVPTVLNSDLVGKVLAEQATAYNGVKFGQVWNSFNGGTVTITDEDGNAYITPGSVAFAAAPKSKNGSYVDSSDKATTDTKKYVEASTITISGFAKGTYDVKYVVEAYGVKYTYVAELEVVEPTYGLATVSQFVKDGVVSVSGVTTMPEIVVNTTGNITSQRNASFESNSINLKDYFQVEGVSKEYAGDVKVVYTVKKYADEDTYIAPSWYPELQYFNMNGFAPASTVASSEVSDENGKVLKDNAFVTWNYTAPLPTNPALAINDPLQNYTDNLGALDRVEITAYLVKSSETATTDEDLAEVAYDKETITIVQKDRISSFSQVANSGTVAYKNGDNTVNIMPFLEAKDFNGNRISNPYATKVDDYWYTPTGYQTNVVNAGVASLYHQEIIFGTPECDLLTAKVEIDNNGNLKFTNNSADLQSDVVVTIPVYLTYDYDNFGSTAKKVDVKVTFSSNVADDSTEGDDTTTEGGDSNTGNSNGADDLLDDSMGI